MVDFVYGLTTLRFSYIPVFYHYINLNPGILLIILILTLGIFVSLSTASEEFYCDFFEAFGVY